MKRKQYNREFKLEAVRRLKLREQTVASLARELDIPRNKLYRWEAEVKLELKGEIEAFRGHPRPKPANASLDEIEQLRRRAN